MNIKNNARKFSGTIKNIARETALEVTRSCFRVYTAIVTRAPYTDSNKAAVCDVRLTEDSTVLTLPYSSKLSTIQVGEMVLVATIYNSLSNAVVWETYNFN